MKKNISEQKIRKYFGYESPSFLVKDLNESNQNEIDITEKYLAESKKILDFNKQKKVKELQY